MTHTWRSSSAPVGTGIGIGRLVRHLHAECGAGDSRLQTAASMHELGYRLLVAPGGAALLGLGCADSPRRLQTPVHWWQVTSDQLFARL